eukprot:CAMPEP_0206489878 /NCGR_PEP_ID=MMETSP0324_2-20121206/43608_1 /ASSEMBLY_ACC=CAM_ASM_000836 /TAXON_ID=2866 /ORGANISM="Crypthecodinium cohnii, Strain Seligo" /LENGTH=237 /DNA_ID=CAMNT_0053969853 /DNA_START=217 /DNA_END=926 /DNA_ORIENTATION=+
MPPSKSYGVFVSQSVVADHDRDALRRLCFRSTSAAEFPWRNLDAEDRLAAQPESFQNTYFIGSKVTPHMGLMPRRAQLWNRDDSMYSTHFQERPVGGAALNNMAAETWNPKFRPPPAHAPLDPGQSIYGTDFKSDEARRRKAMQQPQRPLTSASPTTGKLLELRSSTHTFHRAHDPEVVSRSLGASWTPQDNLSSSASPKHTKDMLRSTYQGNFTGERMPQRPKRELARSRSQTAAP